MDDTRRTRAVDGEIADFFRDEVEDGECSFDVYEIDFFDVVQDQHVEGIELGDRLVLWTAG